MRVCSRIGLSLLVLSEVITWGAVGRAQPSSYPTAAPAAPRASGPMRNPLRAPNDQATAERSRAVSPPPTSNWQPGHVPPAAATPTRDPSPPPAFLSPPLLPMAPAQYARPGNPEQAATVARRVSDAPAALTAATSPSEVALTEDPLTPEQVNAYLKELDARGDPSEAAKEAKELFRQALKSLDAAVDAEKKTAEWRAEQTHAPDLIQQAKTRLAARVEEPKPAYPAEATLAQLEQALHQVEDAWQEARRALAEKEQLLDAKSRADRKAELTRLKAKAKEQLEEAEKDLKGLNDGTGASLLARRTEVQARRRMYKSQLECYDAEKSRWEALAELFPLERDWLQRRTDAAERLVMAWRGVVTARRAAESERQAAQARRLASQAHPTLRELADKNVQLAERQSVLNQHLKQVATQREEAEKLLGQLHTMRKKIEDKVDSVGMTPTVGLLMRTQRDHLPDPRLYRQRMQSAASEMQRVQTDLMELESDRAAMSHLDQELERLLADIESRTAGRFQPGYLKQMTRELLEQRRGFLDKLLVDSDKYFDQLSDLGSETRELLNTLEEFGDYIDEHVLWIRSAAPLRVSDFSAASKAVHDALYPGHWWQVVRDASNLAWQHPLGSGLLAIPFLLLFAGLTPLRLRLLRLGEQTGGSDGVQFLTMLRALALTAVLASFWPAVLLAAGWWVTWYESASNLTLELSHALRAAAPLLWTVELLRRVCRSGGVAERHFHWHPTALRVLHGRLRWLIMVGLPLLILVPLADDFGDTQGREALGRLVEMAALVVLGLAMHLILRPRGGAVWPYLDRVEMSWLHRTRHGWYLLGAVLPLLLAVVIAIGYGYSAGQLLLRWQQTVWLALGLIFGYTLLSRAVEFYCGYLASRRKSEDASPGSGDPSVSASEGSSTGPSEHEEHREVVTQAVARLQRLLRGAAVLAFLVGGGLIWSATFPALQVVSRTPLGPLTKIVTEITDGTPEVTQVPVTLGDLLLCLATIVGTITLARTIPDLLHVSVLQRLDVDRGARYAVVLMSRYVLTAVGLILAFRFLGITWASLQWLVAAMTVGLGFGLQEIFANFVSGLIILFERPVRIGDVITVNGTTGKVTRMQIRATTITDADRRELIVPNKKFITDEVINWTLSDATTRLVIPVGISYDCDPTQAVKLLVQLAKAHPHVLKEPAPSALLKGFGNSTLDLELRVFVGTGEVKGDVQHDLNVAIDRAFREAGIEIAFPQQDIRIRGLPATLKIETAPPAGAVRNDKAA